MILLDRLLRPLFPVVMAALYAETGGACLASAWKEMVR